MAITDPLLLPSDVVLVPVAELSAEVRRQLSCDEGDFAITRPRIRTPSRIVDAGAAELLREFAGPSTIVEAVIRFARARGADPQATLDDAFPLLERLLAAGFLVAEGGDGADGIRPSLARGESAGGWQVIETVQVLEDTEIHLTRGEAAGGTAAGARLDPRPSAALKIERPGCPPAIGAALVHEAAVLAALAEPPGGASGEPAAAAVAPRLLAAGEHAGRRYLAIEWCAGVTADAAAHELRQTGERAPLAALCRDIAGAYARLHERGFVHGDVHPRNALVGPAGEIRLIDFGLAVPLAAAGASSHGAPRGGVGFFFEPEYAAAVRAAGALPFPAATPAGEQYAVAALLYWLAAGAHYLDFSLEKEEMFRQIAEEPALPFAGRGTQPWPALEAILARALAKSPQERFPSLTALAAALAGVADAVNAEAASVEEAPAEAGSAKSPAAVAAAAPSRALLAEVLAEVDLGGSLGASAAEIGVGAPSASVFFGAGGIAYALYRLALGRDDAHLLALADLWLARAEEAAAGPGAFLNPAMEMTAEVVGRVSPYHTASGLAAVRALVAHAQGDSGSARDAAAHFARLALAPIAETAAGAELPGGTENPDLTLGRSGALLVAALLADVLPDGSAERALLGELGAVVLARLWDELDRLPPIAAHEIAPNLGMSHGWAGYAYAALRWCAAFGRPHPAGLAARLAELADAAEPSGRGLRWPWNTGGADGSPGSMAGWCNGSAGFVHLWTLAERALGEPRFRDFAVGAAWNAWEGADSGGGLCCGAAGRAYALAHLARHLGGDRRWLARARTLADRAATMIAIAAGSEKADSLFKGRIGVALLAADLERPELAALPFFEDEGWRGGGTV